MLSCVLALLCAVFILVADQLSKYYIATSFELGESVDFIKGLINIVYVQNRGVAWGMMSGKTWLILALTAAVMIVCIVMLIKLRNGNSLLFYSLTLVVSGGVGNLIDRIFREGIVVDFLQFDFWQSFPVFNIADCAIVIGGAMLILYFILDTVKEYKIKNLNKEQLQKVNNEEN